MNHVSLLEVNVDVRVGVRGLEILQHYNFTVGLQFFAAAKGLLRQSIRRGCRKVQAHKRAVVWLCHDARTGKTSGGRTPQLESGAEGQNPEELEGGDAGAKPARGHYLEQYRATVRSPVPVQC